MKDPMYTSCSDWEEKLAAVHLDDLLPAERRAFNRHAASCAACAAILADYLDIDALIRRSLTPRRPLELPQDFVFEIEQKTGEEQLVEQIFANQSIDLLQEATLIVEEAQKQWKEHIPTTRRPLEFSSRYPSVSVVIPIQNDDEIQNLHYVLRSIPPIVTEVILVGSFQNEAIAILSRHLPTNARIIVQTGKGKSNALIESFDACTGNIIVTLEANGSTNPAEIPLFVSKLIAGNHLAKGSRFIKGGVSNDTNLLRSLSSYGLSKFVSKLFKTPLSDLCYGYTAFWKHCLNYLEIDCDSSGIELETLLYLRMLNHTLKVVEVPSVECPSIDGQSEWPTFQYFWKMLKVLVKARMTGRIRDIHQSVYMEILPNLKRSHGLT